MDAAGLRLTDDARKVHIDAFRVKSNAEMIGLETTKSGFVEYLAKLRQRLIERVLRVFLREFPPQQADQPLAGFAQVFGQRDTSDDRQGFSIANLEIASRERNSRGAQDEYRQPPLAGHGFPPVRSS